MTVRWIGEYHAAKSISLQKQTDALEKLKAEQILNRKLQEQNAMLESQQQQLREAAARAEAAQRGKPAAGGRSPRGERGQNELPCPRDA